MLLKGFRNYVKTFEGPLKQFVVILYNFEGGSMSYRIVVFPGAMVYLCMTEAVRGVERSAGVGFGGLGGFGGLAP